MPHFNVLIIQLSAIESATGSKRRESVETAKLKIGLCSNRSTKSVRNSLTHGKEIPRLSNRPAVQH
jgi:rRNA maturation endonuclease Nob1